jgi:EAL domain-containing protein (putative c-di-GMP-specific phosphodiesterase class I)
MAVFPGRGLMSRVQTMPFTQETAMNTAELHRLHDQALRDARRERDAAIDDFWRGVNAALWAQLSDAQRAATRLAHRLQRHQHQRGAGA